VALIGLRGAGKSTLGQMLAEDLGFPFVELSREIEKFAGCSISEIQACTARTPTAATSAARWKRRSRSTPRR
jgi:shikimate kinase